MEFAKRRAAALFGDVKEVSVASIHEARMLIREGAAAVRQGSAQAVTTARRESRVNVDFVLERAGSHTMRARATVDASFAVMSQGARQAVQDARSSSEALMREIAGQGPQKTLGRGFAIVRDTSDGPVTRAAQVAPGQAVSVQFADGSVRVKVDREKK